jgi:O-acetyl-ADP-ribose deacetylase (regulator of RNase III)
MRVDIVEGDLLDQDVEVIVNAWNRNVFPWWLLLPQGVSAAIKRRGGHEPFKELRKCCLIPLGGAVVTGAGRLGYEAIIHVAGLNLFWFATKYSIQQSVRSAMRIVGEKGYRSVAFPVIGSGSGNRSREKALAFMLDAFEPLESRARVVIVEYRKVGQAAADK